MGFRGSSNQGYIRPQPGQRGSERIEDAKKSHSVQCRHVPTKVNPADMASRGLHHKEFQDQFKFWIQGPDFLPDPTKWPKSEVQLGRSAPSDAEPSVIKDRKAVFQSRPNEVCAATSTPAPQQAAPRTQPGVSADVAGPLSAPFSDSTDPMKMPTLFELLTPKMPAKPMLEDLEKAEKEEIKLLQEEYFGDVIKACLNVSTRTIIIQHGDLKDRQLWLDEEGILRFVPRHPRTLRRTKSAPEVQLVEIKTKSSPHFRGIGPDGRVHRGLLLGTSGLSE